MSTEKIQSAIAEVRDQLSLDYADQQYLNVVAANLGLSRPPIGFTDDTWRAVVKLIALHYKQVASKFDSVLTVMLGPKVTQTTALRESADLNSRFIQLHEDAHLPQTGVVVLDEGLPSEESIVYSIIERGARKYMYLNSLTTVPHIALSADVSRAVVVDAPVGSTAITVHESFAFPTEFPYTLLLGAGTDQEEAVVVTGITGDDLDLAAPTTLDHFAPQPTILRTLTAQDYFATAHYVQLADVSAFPTQGFLWFRGAVDELVYYHTIDYTQNVVYFSNVLTNTFPAASVVELAEVLEHANTAQVQVKGLRWDLYQASSNTVEIYLPPEVQDINTVLSASYLHKAASAPTATALTAPAGAGDTTLTVTSTAGFPTVGVITLGVESFTYTIQSPTVFALQSEVVGAYLPTASVTLYEPTHAGTDTLDGNLWLLDDVFPGPYLYDQISPAPSNVASTLVGYVSGPTTLMLDSPINNITALEVQDASAFPTVTPFPVLVGERTANQEVVEVQGVFLKQLINEVVTAAPGGNTIEVAVAAPFPVGRGYRIRIGRGTPNEEVGYVLNYAPGTGVFTLENALANAHTPGETLELITDVLVVSPTTRVHFGAFDFLNKSATFPPLSTTGRKEQVAPLYSEVELATTTGFADGGTILLNFANKRLNFRTSLVASAAPGTTVLQLADTSQFPTSYPYSIVVNPGGFDEENLLVSNNDTALNELTVTATQRDHDLAEDVLLVTGDTQPFTYTGVSGSFLTFSPPTVFPGTYWEDTVFTHSPADSVPTIDGFSFPFRLPLDIRVRLQYLVDLVRAAGVEVLFVDQR